MIGTSRDGAQLVAQVATVAVGEGEVEEHEVGGWRAKRARASATDRAATTSKPSRERARENGSAIAGSSSTNRMRAPRLMGSSTVDAGRSHCSQGFAEALPGISTVFGGACRP